MALNKHTRLKGSVGVKSVFAGARPRHEGGLSIRAITNTGRTVFAVVVPMMVSPSAVRRNSLRRRVVECLRGILREQETTSGWSVVITARGGSLSVPDIKASLVLLLKKSGILHR